MNGVPIERYQELAYAICKRAYDDLVTGFRKGDYVLIKDSRDFFYSHSFSVYCPHIDPDYVVSLARKQALGK